MGASDVSGKSVSESELGSSEVLSGWVFSSLLPFITNIIMIAMIAISIIEIIPIIIYFFFFLGLNSPYSAL